MLAGQKKISETRFVMCNKDQAICVGVREPVIAQAQINTSRKEKSPTSYIRNDYFGRQISEDDNMTASLLERQLLSHESGNNMGGGGPSVSAMAAKQKDFVHFSNDLDIEVAGDLTKVSEFTVKTDQLIGEDEKKKFKHRQYDFAMSSQLALADPDDFIYTKMIVMSPKYVLVNQMKAPIEVAQIYSTEDSSYEREERLDEGDRKEWVWQDHNEKNLLCVRKMRYSDLTCSYASSSDIYDG